jgi:predicted dehydrogenase
MHKTKIGVIGCGNISGIYLEKAQTFDILEVKAVADIIPERSKAKAEEFHIPCVYTDEELLADPEIDIVVNLTPPLVHAEIGLLAVEAGKSVYDEKPLTVRREDAAKILKIAAERGLRVGGAPDTFLGGGLQTCRKLIDDGWIGEPIAATAFMLCHGHESWHPSPEFYYQVGGGPMFDMGPYYLTALVSLMGPVARVSGSTRITFPTRTITSKPKYGTVVDVEIPTHVAGVLDFANGAIATLVTSFDVWSAEVPRIEIYGTRGTLSVPDPNTFGGPVRLRLAGASEWSDVPLSHGYTTNSRSLGVADMAYGLRFGRPHRANGEMAYHVLDIMHAVHEAAQSGKRIDLSSTCTRPAPLPLGLLEGRLDE